MGVENKEEICSKKIDIQEDINTISFELSNGTETKFILDFNKKIILDELKTYSKKLYRNNLIGGLILLLFEIISMAYIIYFQPLPFILISSIIIVAMIYTISSIIRDTKLRNYVKRINESVSYNTLIESLQKFKISNYKEDYLFNQHLALSKLYETYLFLSKILDKIASGATITNIYILMSESTLNIELTNNNKESSIHSLNMDITVKREGSLGYNEIISTKNKYYKPLSNEYRIVANNTIKISNNNIEIIV